METIEVQIVYKAKQGASFSNKKAQVIGEELARIQTKNNGALTAPQVVKEAQKKKSLLHPYFDWEDNEAARKWRLWQARNIINHIDVVYVDNGKEKTKPMYLNILNVKKVDNEEESERAYIDIVTVGNNEYMRQQALKDALSQLIHWREKYKWLKELDTIVTKITELEKELI